MRTNGQDEGSCFRDRVRGKTSPTKSLTKPLDSRIGAPISRSASDFGRCQHLPEGGRVRGAGDRRSRRQRQRADQEIGAPVHGEGHLIPPGHRLQSAKRLLSPALLRLRSEARETLGSLLNIRSRPANRFREFSLQVSPPAEPAEPEAWQSGSGSKPPGPAGNRAWRDPCHTAARSYPHRDVRSTGGRSSPTRHERPARRAPPRPSSSTRTSAATTRSTGATSGW